MLPFRVSKMLLEHVPGALKLLSSVEEELPEEPRPRPQLPKVTKGNQDGRPGARDRDAKGAGSFMYAPPPISRALRGGLGGEGTRDGRGESALR